jgi:hypothetical protein
MRTALVTWSLLDFILFVSMPRVGGFLHAQTSGGQMLSAALYAEQVEGDLQKAIDLYNGVVRLYASDRGCAARAYLQLGRCMEKLGRPEAWTEYQQVINTYPDQVSLCAAARRLLSRMTHRTAADSLAKYYLDRFGIDIMSSMSYDGRFFAFTEWTSGNLVVENIETGERTKLTDTDWSRSDEYALHPRWSRDGSTIAYGWYGGPFSVELRTTTLLDRTTRVIWSQPGLIITPHDWSPDGTTLVCRMVDVHRAPGNRLVLVSPATGSVTNLAVLDGNSRGLTFSPDARYVALDLAPDGRRNVYVLSLKDSTMEMISGGLPTPAGYDAPVWSRDGKSILFRAIGSNDLWAAPIHEGKIAGRPRMVQPDLTRAMLSLKGVNHHSIRRELGLRRSKTPVLSFNEEFSDPRLDSQWTVTEWNQPNVYGFKSFGRYSLTDHPGYLRYFLDPIMENSNGVYLLPVFSGWYWVYPSLELSRRLAGNRWILEARATYSMVDGANGREIELFVYLDAGNDSETKLMIRRGKDIVRNDGEHLVKLWDHGVDKASASQLLSPRDTLGVKIFSYSYKIVRLDTLLTVYMSDDGESFREALRTTLRADLLDRPQAVALTGGSWFVPAGSYADWDFVRFRQLGPEPAGQ